MSSIISEFTNKKLITYTHFISGTGLQGKSTFIEIIQKISDDAVWHFVLICPYGFFTENAFQPSNYSTVNIFCRICVFNHSEYLKQLLTNIFSSIENIIPMSPFRYLDGRVLHHLFCITFSALFFVLLIFLIPNITYSFEKNQRENIIFICRRIDLPPKVRSCTPKVILKFFYCYLFCHDSMH